MKACCVICNYNYSQFISEAITSCLNQTVPFHEIIIVDDGLTDESVQIVKEHFSQFPQANYRTKAIK